MELRSCRNKTKSRGLASCTRNCTTAARSIRRTADPRANLHSISHVAHRASNQGLCTKQRFKGEAGHAHLDESLSSMLHAMKRKRSEVRSSCTAPAKFSLSVQMISMRDGKASVSRWKKMPSSSVEQ